mmetsp:Transcript_21706/g.74609  ORF Transcript_21706/g.74609 Transcript_21706/m.74609 type:complete len:100 (-) Transcript_21706:145-444(-)
MKLDLKSRVWSLCSCTCRLGRRRAVEQYVDAPSRTRPKQQRWRSPLTEVHSQMLEIGASDEVACAETLVRPVISIANSQSLAADEGAQKSPPQFGESDR